MAISNKTSLKSRFETGDRPTQADFENLLDTAIRDPLVAIASAAEGGKTGLIEVQGTAQATAWASAGALPLTVDVTGAKRRSLKERFADRINAKDYLEADGVTDDTSAANALFSTLTEALTDSSARAAVFFPKGTYRFDDGLRINAHRLGIEADQASFDFSNMTSGAALAIFNSAAAIPQLFDQWVNTFRGFNMFGPGGDSEVDAIVFSGGQGTGANRVAFYDTRVDGFRTGVRFGSGSYLNSFYHAEFENCSVACHFPDGLTDAGENISFFGGLIGQSDLPVLVCGAATFSFHGTSFDFNERLVQIDSPSKVDMISCHWESDTLTVDYPIHVSGNGAVFRYIGGDVLGGDDSSTIDAYVHTVTAADGVIFRDVFMHQMDNTVSAKFVVGGGRCEVENISTFGVPEYIHHLGVSADYSRLRDGGFEESSIIDDIFISDDGGTISSRVSGAFVKEIAVTTSLARSGSQSMRIHKQFPANSGDAAVFVITPCQAGDVFSFKGYVNTTAGGTIFLNTGFGRFSPRSTVVATAAAGIPYDSTTKRITTVSVAGSTTGWAEMVTTPVGTWSPRRAPPWATHWYMELNIGGLNSGRAYFDDFLITKVA